MKRKQIKILFFMLLVNLVGYSQQKIEISPYAGFNQPLGDFANFSQGGLAAGLSMDYFFGPSFGLGLDFNLQKNAYNYTSDYSRIYAANPTSPFTIVESKTGGWSNLNFGIGPVYRIDLSQFHLDIYTKPGVSMVTNPVAYDELASGSNTANLYEMNDAGKRSGFGITSGLRFGYEIGDNLSFFANPQYVYSSVKVNYFIRDIELAFQPTSSGENFIPMIAMFDTDLIESTLKLSHFNFNVGLTYSIPTKVEGGGGSSSKENKKKESKKKADETVGNDSKNSSVNDENFDEEQNTKNQEPSCPNSLLISPANRQQFLANSELKPVFKWSNLSKDVKGYVFRLYDDKGIVYSKKMKTSVLTGDEKLNAILNKVEGEKQEYQWDVQTSYSNCETKTSDKKSFTIKSQNGIQINITEIECLTPAYDQNGDVHYKAKMELASFSNSSNWVINNFSLIESNQTIQVSSIHSCPPVSPEVNASAPLTIASNTTEVYCFEFSVPIGTTSQTIQTNGTLGVGAGSVSTDFELPNCICDVCSEWEFIASGQNATIQNDNNSNVQINSDFKILNSENIQKVDAEVVSVKHNVNDVQCYTCTKDDNHMALFGKTTCSVNNGGNWENSGRGQLTDVNDDGYGNKLTWIAKTIDGADFNTNHKFRLNLNFPEMSKLDCCSSEYSICIRYTFTNIDCQTCSYLVCYDFDSNDLSSGDGNSGDGQQSGAAK